MLVLSRKIGERIRIGSNVWLTVCCIEKGKVRLAFDAPQDVVIDREETAARRDLEALDE